MIGDQILQGGLYVDVSMCVLSCTELHDLTHSRHKFLLSPYAAVRDPFPKHMHTLIFIPFFKFHFLSVPHDTSDLSSLTGVGTYTPSIGR